MGALKMAAGLVGRQSGELLLAMVVLVALLVVLNLWLWSRMGRLSRSYARLMRGSTTDGLEQALYEHVDRVNAAVARADQVAETCRDLDQRLRLCVQRVGFVRFDAFGDVGGELSFALALLDDAGDGMVLSSLHGRQDTRMYAKPVRDGQCEVALTTEEAEALRRAGADTEGARVVRVPDMGRSARR